MEKTPSNIEQYQGNYSESGLWAKLKKVAKKAGEKVIYHVLILYYVLMDPDTPAKHKTLIIGTLGYFILPIDLIPDIIPVIGYSDDLAALVACFKAVNDCVTPDIESKAKAKLSTWF